ncbi:hypothetical protein ACROYT_G012052 [Oculina patagonica]
MPVTAPHKCDVRCEQEITCQSYNYVIEKNLCELNNRTKEATPENFRSDPASFYIRRLNGRAPLGSIPELPAQSCQEIKASEGKDTISSKYWLDPAGNGTAVLVYCDMNLADWKRSAFPSPASRSDACSMEIAKKKLLLNPTLTLFVHTMTKETREESSAP